MDREIRDNRAILEVDPDELVKLLGISSEYKTDSFPYPSVYYDYDTHKFWFKFYHPSFPKVPDGGLSTRVRLNKETGKLE
jgi:hypothetical protein